MFTLFSRQTLTYNVYDLLSILITSRDKTWWNFHPRPSNFQSRIGLETGLVKVQQHTMYLQNFLDLWQNLIKHYLLVFTGKYVFSRQPFSISINRFTCHFNSLNEEFQNCHKNSSNWYKKNLFTLFNLSFWKDQDAASRSWEAVKA